MWLVAASSACSTDASELVPAALNPATFEAPLTEPAIRDPLGRSTVSSQNETAAEPQSIGADFIPRAGHPGVPDEATQALVVTTSSWKDHQGKLRRFERRDGASPWAPARKKQK
jgi:hypothetical protein